MIIAALLNIGLDCLFVFVFHWGIIGAAMASLLAQLVSFLYCLFAIVRIEYVSLDKQDWKLDFCRIKSMLLFGIPISFQYVVITMGGMILQSSINLQGSVFIAGYTERISFMASCNALQCPLDKQAVHLFPRIMVPV